MPEGEEDWWAIGARRRGWRVWQRGVVGWLRIIGWLECL